MFYDTPRTKNSVKFHNYRNFIKRLTLNLEEYEQLKRAFAGGFTHANPFYSGEIVENVDSFDFTSSYPYVMVSEKFPMSTPQKVIIKSEDDFRKNLKKYCCLFDVTFYNLKPKVYYENYISVSKCRNIKGVQENNGRVVQATELTITITEQDFLIIEKFYSWDSIKVFNFKRMIKDYLPKDLILSILDLYKKKTELKDIEEYIVEYMVSKNMINAVYGMTVTDICRDEILYDYDWYNEKPDYEQALEKYNNSLKRFLYYPWGIWVTAYARKNLFTGIYEFGEDYRYSDTDSIKVVNTQNHINYINAYNNMVRTKLFNMCKHYNIDVELTKPKNKYGEEKELGIWEHECTYIRFKTLGAKRYLTELKKKINGRYENVLTLTVSGVNKKKAIEYLIYKYGYENVFDVFSDKLEIPALYINNDGKEVSATGKMTHTYIDEEKEGYLTDYLGNREYYKELSAIHLKDCEYNLSLSEIYINFLLNIKQLT